MHVPFGVLVPRSVGVVKCGKAIVQNVCSWIRAWFILGMKTLEEAISDECKRQGCAASDLTHLELDSKCKAGGNLQVSSMDDLRSFFQTVSGLLNSTFALHIHAYRYLLRHAGPVNPT